MGQAKPSRRLAIVVEDDVLQSSLAGTLLEEVGFEVVECDSAEAALEMLENQSGRVALVFTDVNLAGRVDGLELAKIVRHQFPDTAVFVTSSYIGERPNRLTENTFFMPKPWLPLDLLMAAERVRAN